MSDNWVVGNLQNALDTWNAKVTELWNLILTSPQNFKGGGIWTAITNVNTAMQALGTGLLVLFFVIGVVKTCGSFTDLKKPEHAVKLFVRFILSFPKRIKTFGTIRNSDRARNGANDNSVWRGAKRYRFNYDSRRCFISNEHRIAGRLGIRYRKLRILGEYSLVGGHAYRRTVHHHNVLHYDYERVRQILQALYVHGYRSYSAFDLCG